MVVTTNNSVYITGLAHEYPQYTMTQEQSADLFARLAPEHITSPGSVQGFHHPRNLSSDC